MLHFFDLRFLTHSCPRPCILNPKNIAEGLFEEIRAAGYPGGYTQVKAYVREVRPQPPADPVVRFETPPGFQAQVDFGTFNLPCSATHGSCGCGSFLARRWRR